MGSISVRKIDDEILDGLRIRASRRGVSMEEEVRQILKDVVKPPERLGDIARRYFGPQNGLKDFELPSRGELHEPIDFSE
ncbi:MAG: plasmid stabilization protein [Sphingomonadales bacterium]